MKEHAFVLCSSIIKTDLITTYPDVFYLNLQVSIDGDDFNYSNSTSSLNLRYIKDNTVLTSLPNIQVATELLTDLSNNYKSITIISPSREFSGTYAMLKLILKDFNQNIKLYDTDCIAIDEAMFFENLVTSQIDNLENVESNVILKDMKYLKKSGRISGVQQLFLSSLNFFIKISTDNSKVVKKNIFRSQSGLLKKIVKNNENKNISKIIVAYVEEDEDFSNNLINCMKSLSTNVEVVDNIPLPVLAHFGTNVYAYSILYEV